MSPLILQNLKKPKNQDSPKDHKQKPNPKKTKTPQKQFLIESPYAVKKIEM